MGDTTDYLEKWQAMISRLSAHTMTLRQITVLLENRTMMPEGIGVEEALQDGADLAEDLDDLFNEMIDHQANDEPRVITVLPNNR